ncbi:EF-hand domain-containing protein [Parasphingopyxis marina]|uniref:EF-hand domain-containing protein n=1 Tax=Parasphingopyxis marina TaxID=2761622 RepID=A0A842HUT9_9SPHN|nr:EF-hand domain-containing protein [Parasphingopyxis marina]MBC2776151.1 EF-hand domain-containing protein [Parasphingopyxis marina]
MDRGIAIGLTSFVVTAAILAIPSVAQSHGRGDSAEPMTRAQVESRIAAHFAEADADGDGAISREEADARHAARRAEREDRNFARLDSNGDGEISVAERDAARSMRAERRGARRGARRHAMMAEERNMRGRVGGEEMAQLRGEAPAAETPTERHARWLEHRNEAWSSADADGNGSLNRAEYDAMSEARAARMRAHGDRAATEGRSRGARHAAHFERMDSDSDGRVTLAEISERALARFDRADANSDGTVTPEERRAAVRRAMHAERREQRDN